MGRFVGVDLQADHRDYDLFLREDGTVVVYDRGEHKVSYLDDPSADDLESYAASESELVRLCAALGLKAVVEI